jgi:hypothetical protein
LQLLTAWNLFLAYPIATNVCGFGSAHDRAKHYNAPKRKYGVIF